MGRRKTCAWRREVFMSGKLGTWICSPHGSSTSVVVSQQFSRAMICSRLFIYAYRRNLSPRLPLQVVMVVEVEVEVEAVVAVESTCNSLRRSPPPPCGPPQSSKRIFRQLAGEPRPVCDVLHLCGYPSCWELPRLQPRIPCACDLQRRSRSSGPMEVWQYKKLLRIFVRSFDVLLNVAVGYHSLQTRASWFGRCCD